MKKINEWTRASGSERGAVLVLVAAAIVVLLGFAGLAIDVGHLMASRNEAQNVADAAALAGAGELGDQHYNKQDPINEGIVEDVVIEVSEANTIAGESMNLVAKEDIEIGYWNTELHVFSSSPFSDSWIEKKNAVRVTAKRSANAPISTFFMKVLGRDTFSVSAKATAALSGASIAPEGDLIPVGISSYWYEYDWGEEDEFCNQQIQFSPTGSIEGCSGWNTFYDSPSSASKLRKIFEGIMDNSTSSPETSVGSEFEFTGGNVKSALCQPVQTDFEDMYNLYKDDEDNWETSVVVYDAMECENPTGPLKVLGFSTAIIHGVNCETGDAEINATVICDEYNDSRGGGGNYGTFGKIPGLVQ
mgnify:CR=1 FL=1